MNKFKLGDKVVGKKRSSYSGNVETVTGYIVSMFPNSVNRTIYTLSGCDHFFFAEDLTSASYKLNETLFDIQNGHPVQFVATHEILNSNDEAELRYEVSCDYRWFTRTDFEKRFKRVLS